MYSPDILADFQPGIAYAGNVLNPLDGGKILNGIALLPGTENVAVAGYINPAASEQSIISAEKGDVSLSTDGVNGQANMDIQNGQVSARTSSMTADTSNHFNMSDNNINLNRDVNGVGSADISLNDSTISINSNESITNSRITGII